MRHLMPIVTPRLLLRPPDLGDLDAIQTVKEAAWINRGAGVPIFGHPAPEMIN